MPCCSLLRAPRGAASIPFFQHSGFGLVLLAALAAWPMTSIAGQNAALDAARPAEMAESDWQALKSAIVAITGPYAEDGELTPPAPGMSHNHFGAALAVSGNRAVVGAPGDLGSSGSAYILEKDTAGRWVQVQILRHAAPAPFDEFGRAVAIDGNIIAVGAPFRAVAGQPSQGEVVLFLRETTGTWTRLTTLSAGNEFDQFGRSVALQGNTLAVGVPKGFGTGAVFVYARSGASWLFQGNLGPQDLPTGDGFGEVLALDGDRLLVGMPNNGVLSPGCGAGYVFDRAGTSWSMRQRLDPFLGICSRFGAAVALSGDIAVVGNPGYNDSRGAVQTFAFDGSVWHHRSLMTIPSEDAPFNAYGHSLAIMRSGISGALTLAVGAPSYDVMGCSEQGAAFIYTMPSSGDWALSRTLTGQCDDEGELGRAVALNPADDHLLAGAPAIDLDSLDRGRVQVFQHLSSGPWVERPAIHATDDDGTYYFGTSVAISGSTAVISVPLQRLNDSENGAVRVYVRGTIAGDWRLQALLPQPADPGAAQYGGIAIDGDTLVVGVPHSEVGGLRNRGEARIFVRSEDRWMLQATLTEPTGTADDFLGQAVAISGNTVVIGAPGEGGVPGKALVFTRSGTAWGAPQRLLPAEAGPFDQLGWSVAVSADTIAVGAPGATSGVSCAGAAYVFLRTGIMWTQAARLQSPLPLAGDGCQRFGAAVAASRIQVAVGAPLRSAGAGLIDRGAAYVFGRVGTNWPLQSELEAPADVTEFGAAVATTGETIVVGAPGRDQVFAFDRQGTSWPRRGRIIASHGAFGGSVAVSGTLLMAGAPRFGPFSSGRAYILADDLIFANGLQAD